MFGALSIAKTGLDAQQKNLDTIANNLANVNTNGFKKSRPLFNDLMYQNTQYGSATAPTGVSIGTGVRLAGVEKMFQQGTLTQTGNPLDLGIQGDGFFQVQMPNGGVAYTRDGSFKINSVGTITTKEGYALDPTITVPSGATNLMVGKDGVVTARQNGAVINLGQINVTTFANSPGLEPSGDNLFIESVSSGPPNVSTPMQGMAGSLQQGYIEGSNVNAAEEMINMIQAQRAYELNTKVISTADQMLARLTNL